MVCMVFLRLRNLPELRELDTDLWTSEKSWNDFSVTGD